MHYLRFLSILLSMAFIVSSCDDDQEKDLIGNWVNRYEIDGMARSHAVSFTIGNKAYLVSGYNGVERVRLTDCWEFEPEQNQWIQMASFPTNVVGRTSACAFAANGKGYVIGGYYSDQNQDVMLKDVLEFDPVANTWTKLDDFPGSARYGAVGFSVNGKGYLCGGYDGNYLKDLWQFDPTTKTWTQMTSLPGSKRAFAQVFVINDIAYVFGGNSNGKYVDDFWAYDYSTNSWTAKRDISNSNDNLSYDDDYSSIVRENGVTFVINGYGYVATGDVNSIVSTTWEYDPSRDIWTEKTAFEGTSRTNAVGATINNRGFVFTGKTSSLYLDDVWEFHPFEDVDDDDN